tara:strand:- start:81 stop:593 length:513 start_codon:yes stop_codon:yes gene_type:complete
MSRFNNLIILTFLFILPVNLLSANEKTVFIDVEYIIQNSNIGKKSLNKIKVLNDKNIGLLEKKNKSLNELEISIRNKKNIISVDEFNNEVIGFQKKVKDFTSEKDQTVKAFNKFRKQELENILKLFRPVITSYMNENSINILLDSKNIFMGNSDVDVTEDVLKKINIEVK